MVRSKRSRLLLPATLCLLSLVLAAGCGTAAYEARLNQRLAQMGQLKQFEALYGQPLTLPGTSASVRIPKVFRNAYDATTADPDTGQAPVDPRRLQPPFVPLPGFKMTYEAFETDSAGAQLPFYCYLAVATASDAAGGSLAETLRTQVASTFPGATWEDVSCPTPAGGAVACRRISVAGPQEFRTGAGQYTSLPGRFQLYLHEQHGQTVLIGWRVPDAIADKARLDELAMLTCGTIQVSPPAGG